MNNTLRQSPFHRTAAWALCLAICTIGHAPAHASSLDLPPIDRIVKYQPKLPLVVLTSDGVEIAQFGSERREYVPLSRTPKMLQQAVLSIEDSRFHEHSGIDPKGMMRAVVSMLTGGRKQGASTITQQLVRTMLLTREQTAERKVKEIMLSLKVEQALSKDRILEIYLNEIFLGQRAYGFAAAAQTYFGKSMDQLSIAETAVLAGLPQNPSYANPIASYERAIKRQRLVLDRMKDTGAITDAQYQTALNEKIVVRPPSQHTVSAGHVAEMARRAVVDRFGNDVYSSGIKVITSLVAAEQRAAFDAVQRGILNFDARTPWRGPENHEPMPAASGGELDSAATQALKAHKDDDLLRVAMVISATPIEVQAILANGEHVNIKGDGLRFAKAGLAANAKSDIKIEKGAVIRLMHAKTGNSANPSWSIAQWPEAEAALVALDTHTGRVRALVGGFDFDRQPFNNVTQAWRQPGSSLKPLFYSAALENRVMPATLVDDLPFTAANGWSPDNSNHQHSGPIALREGLTKSSNLVSVRVLQHVGVAKAREWVSRFGLDANRQPDNLTFALGTGSVTPMQMARAYATLANGGWRLEPVVVEKIIDAKGKVLFEAPPPEALTEDKRAIPERNTFVMSSILNDVTRIGTAAKAQAQLKRPDVYGKTGTTSDVLDAWFAGYHPNIAAVVWMGYSTPKSLGDRESGGRLALPIWTDFMATALKNTPISPPPVPPVGLANVNGDWVYTEWQHGGWISQLSDTNGTVVTQPNNSFIIDEVESP